MTVPLAFYLIVAGILFFISMLGIVINRRNLIVLLMCLELMLLSVNTNLIAFSRYLDNDLPGQLFVFFTLAVAAAESALGLAIFILVYRKIHSVDVRKMSQLKQ